MVLNVLVVELKSIRRSSIRSVIDDLSTRRGAGGCTKFEIPEVGISNWQSKRAFLTCNVLDGGLGRDFGVIIPRVELVEKAFRCRAGFSKDLWHSLMRMHLELNLFASTISCQGPLSACTRKGPLGNPRPEIPHG